METGAATPHNVGDPFDVRRPQPPSDKIVDINEHGCLLVRGRRC
jgi:hypothetical protein